MDYSTVIRATEAALSHRDSRRDALARRIVQLTEQALEAARVPRLDLGAAGVLEYRTPEQDVSQNMQYEGGGWYGLHARQGEPVLCVAYGRTSACPSPIETRTLEPVDCGYWDGHNYQYPRSRPRDARSCEVLRQATVAQLRAIARALPVAIAKLLDEAASRATAQAEEADAALASLAAV